MYGVLYLAREPLCLENPKYIAIFVGKIQYDLQPISPGSKQIRNQGRHMVLIGVSCLMPDLFCK